MNEIVSLRQENSKTYDLGGRHRGLLVSIGAIHYKDDYADSGEPWKDIDLTWEGNRITKAPYELTLEGNKVTIKDKKSGEISTIELLEIGGQVLPVEAWVHSQGLAKRDDTDLEIVVENSAVRFARILNSDKAPAEAKYRVTGKIPFAVRAWDAQDELPVETTLVDGILTEILKPDRPVKHPVRIDPTWQVAAITDDCRRDHVSGNYFGTAMLYQAAGYQDGLYTDIGGGMRFLNITIPVGGTITLAQLKMIAVPSGNNTVNTRLRAQANVNPATFSNAADFDARTWTTAFIRWDAIPSWTGEVEYTSPDIKTCIQEVVNLPGWASGNPIVVEWDDWEKRSTQAPNMFRYAYAYDGSTIKAPKLYIEYTTLPPPPVTETHAGWDRNSDIFTLRSRDLLNGYRPDDIVTNGLVLNLPLYRYKGSKFKSVDPYQHLCTKTGALWTPQGGDLDGLDDYYFCGNAAALNLTTAISLEVWVNPNAVNPDTWGRYACKWGSYHLGMQQNDETNVRWELAGFATTILNSGAGTVATGVFNHIVGTYDKNAGGNNRIIYIGAVNIASRVDTETLVTVAEQFTIGTLGSSLTQNWKGIIGEVRLYNRALAIQEVRHNRDVTRWRYGV